MSAKVVPFPRSTCAACAASPGRLCWDCEERRNLFAARLDDAVRYFRRVLPKSAVPASSAEFRERVTHPDLRALPLKWSPARGGVLATGESGIGKTTMAGAVVLEGLNQARTSADPEHWVLGSRWTTGPALARSRREARLGSQCEALHEALRASVLILDELGAEGGPPEWLLELADERYSRGLVTVATSGFRRAELEGRYGVAAVRRLVEPGGTVFNCFGGAGE